MLTGEGSIYCKGLRVSDYLNKNSITIAAKGNTEYGGDVEIVGVEYDADSYDYMEKFKLNSYEIYAGPGVRFVKKWDSGYDDSSSGEGFTIMEFSGKTIEADKTYHLEVLETE
jgi:hypothetical protein